VAIGGVTYVDGGAHSPTNADLLADRQLDLVVVSSPMSVVGNRFRPSLDLPARRLCQFYLGQEVARIRRRSVPVLTFQPTGDDLNAMGMNAMDQTRRKPVTEQARESARKKLERDDVRELLGVLSGVS
jgi:NTE family protein